MKGLVVLSSRHWCTGGDFWLATGSDVVWDRRS